MLGNFGLQGILEVGRVISSIIVGVGIGVHLQSRFSADNNNQENNNVIAPITQVLEGGPITLEKSGVTITIYPQKQLGQLHAHILANYPNQ